MASSGSFGNTFRNGYRIQIDWKITGTNVANNTSTVEATFYLISLGSAFTINSSTNKTVRLRIAGQTYSTSTNVSLSGNQKKPLFTKRVTVSHNADGTKNITLGGNINLNVTLSGKYWSNVAISDKTFTLNTIPRSSTISSFPNFTIGNSFSVSISRASSSFTHKLVLYLGNTYIGEWSGIGTSTTVTPNSTHQDRLYKAMPNSSSATVTLRCYTYSGSTQIGGYKTKTATVTVPSSIVPSFTSISHSEAVGNINTIVGSYVQGLSKLKIDILGATGAKYSTIRSYQITFDGTTYNANNVITNFIKGSGSLTITAKVIDSRGRSATKSTIINVLSYSPPKITKFIIYRSNSSNARDENSSNVRVELNSSFNLLNNKNSATVSIKSKLRGESTWTTKYSTTNTTGNISYANLLSGYDSLRAYDFMIEVKDKFNAALSLGVISAGIIPMSLGVTGIGVGKVWEKGSLDVKGDSYFDGNICLINGGKIRMPDLRADTAIVKDDRNDNFPPSYYFDEGSHTIYEFKYIKNIGQNELTNFEYGTINGIGEIRDSATRIRSKDYVPVSPNTEYTFSVSSGYYALYVSEYNASKEGIQVSRSNNYSNKLTFTTLDDSRFIKLAICNDKQDESIHPNSNCNSLLINNCPVGANPYYVFIQTITGWKDKSGGYPIQIAYGKEGIAYRYGISNDIWGGWIENVTTEQSKTFKAPLRNGHTGTVLYSKNKLGQVWLRGNIYLTGTIGSGRTVAVLPSGYRPNSFGTIIDCYNGSRGRTGSLVLYSNGDFHMRPPGMDYFAEGNKLQFNTIYQAEEV